MDELIVQLLFITERQTDLIRKLFDILAQHISVEEQEELMNQYYSAIGKEK